VYNSGILTLPDKKASAPHWWVNRQTNDTFLVYTGSTSMPVDPSSNSAKTYMQKFSGGGVAGSPQPLVANGGFGGGISGSGTFTATASPYLLVHNITTGQTLKLFGGPDNGKAIGDSSIVDNVSICPDTCSQNKVLFLDYGYSGISTVVGSSYNARQVLFVSDFTGKILTWFKCPAGTMEWNDPQWSNKERTAVAVSVDNAGNRTCIYTIDMIDSVVTPIVQGEDLWQPSLWLDEEQQAPPDSLYRYNYPPSIYQEELAGKMDYFWQQHDAIEILVLGSGLIRNAVDPAYITKFKCLNMSYGGGDLPAILNFTKNYAYPHCPKLKSIVISLDMGWMNQPNADHSWSLGFGQTWGYQYDKSHDFWKQGIPASIMQIAVTNCAACATYNGYWQIPILNWGAQNLPCVGDYTWTTVDANYKKSLASIRQFGQELAAKNIHLVLVNVPVSPQYKQLTCYGYYGPSRQTAHQILQDIRNIELTNSFFHLYDANLDGNHDYTPDEAFDDMHLSYLGAKKLTMRLDSIYQILLK
jgi:hypothetical protein